MIKQLFEFSCKEGLYFPFAHDPVTKQSSVTLLFTYVSFILSLASVIALQFFPQVQTGSLFSIGLFIVCLVFYRLRRLDDVSVNLKSGQIDIKGDSSENG